MRAYERLLNYVKVWTVSDDESATTPSTPIQFDLAKILVEELHALGLENAYCDDKCYVYAILPATKGYEDKTKIGFVAHLDTAPDFNGKDVKPRVIESYDGGDVTLGSSGRVLSVADFPYLANLKGKTLIVTDGESLLGSDDKAGIADIMTMLETLINENIPHGQISVCFTPDEEIGAGADHFDLEAFDAEFAYTVDGGTPREIVYENFNAAAATFEIKGVNIHPGSAKNMMRNAQLVAMEINSMLPACDTPATTEGYEGFYHLCDMEGSVESAALYYIIRDHDKEKFERKKEFFKACGELIAKKYGKDFVKITVKDSYYNMKEKIEPHMYVIERAKKAMEDCGIEPKIIPIRGGTDGARLSWEGLPCPNLCTGGENFHGRFEYISVQSMDKITSFLVRLVANVVVE